jgi:hypothetical protein
VRSGRQALATSLWLAGWARDRLRKVRLALPAGERHLLFALCDHFEPLHGRVPHAVARARVQAWREGYPALASRFRDADGRSPRHTFFFPGEQYHPDLVEPLAELEAAGLAEVEVHLHHDGDTRASLRAKLARTLADLGAHGVVPVRAGRPAWAFIHGNWALANGHPQGRWCGVDDELELLHEMGCYADFTFPSAPDACQPSIVNRIYYPADLRRRGYERAAPWVAGANPDRVLLVQGPLALARREAQRGRGLRLDAGAIDAGDPPTASRLATWIAQHVHVEGRPEWSFVKVHTHGAIERNAHVLLGETMAAFHATLGALAERGWRLHYVTAREMHNVARAAMRRAGGTPTDHFDGEVPPPLRASNSR